MILFGNELLHGRNLRDARIDLQSQAPSNTHHLIGATGWSPHSQYCIGLLQKPNRDGMEDFIESFIANPIGTGQFNKREGQPFSKNRKVAGTENGQRMGLHFLNVLADQSRIVVRSGAVWSCNENRHLLRQLARECDFLSHIVVNRTFFLVFDGH